MKLLDLRCAACAERIRGTETVISKPSRIAKVITCPHCSTRLELVEDEKEDSASDNVILLSYYKRRQSKKRHYPIPGKQ